MPHTESPLKAAQVEGDNLKSKIDEFATKCEEFLQNTGLTDKQTQTKQYIGQCKELEKAVTKLEKKVGKLKKSQEPSTVNKFDEKKKDELTRLASFKTQLENIKDTLSQDEVEEDYFREMQNEKNNNETEGSEEDETIDSDEEDSEVSKEEENATEDTQSEQTPGNKPKFGRLGLFRRSSKSPIKDIKSKVPSKIPEETNLDEDGDESLEPEEDEEEVEENGREKEEQKELSKKEKREREKQEKLLAKELKEKEKRDKKTKEKLEKERKAREKKEQKMKEERKKKKEKGKGKKTEDDEDLEEEAEEQEDVDNQDEVENLEDEMESEEEEEDSEEEDDDAVVDDGVASDTKKNKEDVNAQEKKDIKDPKRGSRGFLFFRAKTPDRKQKAKNMSKDEPSGKEKQDKGGKSSKTVDDERDDVEDEDDEDDEEDDEEEDDEDEESDEEDEVIPPQGKSSGVSTKPGPSRGPSKPSAENSPNRKARIVRQEAEEEDDSQEEDEDEEEYESEDEDDEEGDFDEEELEEEEEEDEDGEGGELEETGSSEDDDDDQEEKDEVPFDGENMFVVLSDFDAEEPTDLSVKQGNVVSILSTREDGWWMAEDEEGNKGLVPSTYLKLRRDSVDYKEVQTPEPEPDAEENISPRSGKELWKSVRKSVHETSATDVLSAMGAIPAGFRPSTTARLLKNEQNKLSSFLKPKLSPSNLAFNDLHWDPQNNQLRAVPCRLQKMLSLVLVRNMPAMGVGLEAKSRHARIAIFDGKEVLSNIHTVQATWNEADLKTWRFSPRVSGLLPSILDGECFIRSDRSDKNIGLLIELCVSYVRTKTGEKGELSCGWVHLPLFSEETGGPIINKLYELQVNGGTPFEQGVEVDPSISRKASTSKLRSMLTANKQPRLHVKLIAPTKEQKTHLETLPFTIVGVASYLPMLSFYRRILADAVLRDRIDIQSTGLIHSPLLANFPKAANLPDVMDGLRSMWNEKKRSTKKSEKRDGEQMKSLFTSAFMESAYPLLYSATLPEYRWPDIESEQVRWESISNFTAAAHQKGILTALLSPGKMHTPFHTSEVSFDVLGAYTNR